MPFGVTFNRPFLFFVRECSTGAIVMASQVSQPQLLGLAQPSDRLQPAALGAAAGAGAAAGGPPPGVRLTLGGGAAGAAAAAAQEGLVGDS